MAWLGAIGPLCGVLLALLQLWAAKQPQRTAKKVENAKTDIRLAIVNGDVSTVERTIDGLLTPTLPATNDSSTGLKNS